MERVPVCPGQTRNGEEEKEEKKEEEKPRRKMWLTPDGEATIPFVPFQSEIAYNVEIKRSRIPPGRAAVLQERLKSRYKSRTKKIFQTEDGRGIWKFLFSLLLLRQGLARYSAMIIRSRIVFSLALYRSKWPKLRA